MAAIATAKMVIRDDEGNLNLFSPGDELPEWVTSTISRDLYRDESAESPETASEPEEDEAPAEGVETSETGSEAPQGDDPEDFDPAEHSVAEVLSYLDTVGETEHARVIAAERSGKNRKTITDTASHADLIG